MNILKRCRFGALVLSLTAMLLGCGGETRNASPTPSPSPTEPKASTPQPAEQDSQAAKIIGKELVQDIAVQQALTEIEEKLFSIQQYHYIENRTTYFPKGRHTSWEERYFSAPNLFAFKMVLTESFSPVAIGLESYTISDGNIYWEFTQEANKSIAPRIVKCDLKRLRSAACPTIDKLLKFENILQPFRHCDMATLSLEKQDDATWTFLAKNQAEYLLGPIDSVRITINKKNGILKIREFLNSSGGIFTTMTVEGFEKNPELDETMFKYEPPAQIQVTDMTDLYILQWRTMKKAPGGQ